MSVLFNALSAAAQAKGAPLSDAERATIARQVQTAMTRETLRLRFINVIKLAGYKGAAPESICAEYLDRYMQDVPKFISMLERYESSRGDPL